MILTNRLIPLGILIGVLLGCPSRSSAAGRGISFCDGKKLQVAVAFSGMPVSMNDNWVTSSTETDGSLKVINVSNKMIERLDSQIEYLDKENRMIGLLWYGGSSSRQRSNDYHDEPMDKGLAPGHTVTFRGGLSWRVFATCPARANLTAIRVLFSDGSEFEQAASPWVFEGWPHMVSPLQFKVGTVPRSYSTYLLRLTVAANGQVEEVQQLDPGSGPLPTQIADRIHEWQFRPQTRGGVPESYGILAVLRIVRKGSGCDLQTCEIPYPAETLFPDFVLISLAESADQRSEAARVGSESFEVYFGTIPVSGSEVVW
ncbi:MAG TPA: hypothetical protein VEH50_10195 [Methylomirabilota bacterium]|nr:hypothetical protein [Methylomirabilota bacterium]